jgi:hydrogenase nickel incorporation protein HypA/HybF
MHELAITQSLIQVALAAAGERKIKGMTIVVGELSGVVEDSVRFCFEVAAAGTVAEGAALSFQKVRASVRCTRCGLEFGLDGASWTCPGCGNLGGRVVQGRECHLQSIDVEDEDEDRGH